MNKAAEYRCSQKPQNLTSATTSFHLLASSCLDFLDTENSYTIRAQKPRTMPFPPPPVDTIGTGIGSKPLSHH